MTARRLVPDAYCQAVHPGGRHCMLVNGHGLELMHTHLDPFTGSLTNWRTAGELKDMHERPGAFRKPADDRLSR